MPRGFVLLPLVDNMHRLINGKCVLNVWPIPVFVKKKGGLKSDPFAHGEEFRFRGPTRTATWDSRCANPAARSTMRSRASRSILGLIALADVAAQIRRLEAQPA